jgi:diguanylate cyclase (GGDEF)-like protein
MQNLVETWKAAPQRTRSGSSGNALLVHIYPPGPSLGSCCPLGAGPALLGREEDCAVRIDDNTVSRRHACIQPGDDGYYAVDLESTNGTFVNDRQVSRCRLQDGDYVRVGNAIYRFLVGHDLAAQYHEEIYRLTIIDALTGIYNKRYLLEFLDRELARSAWHCRPLALVLFDIDYFKTVSDRWGHLAGDALLRELAVCVRPAIRGGDLFARFAGEEFALVLLESRREQALTVSERVRALVEQHAFAAGDEPYRMTISLGAVATEGGVSLAVTDFIHDADKKLYEAKREGRNRVCC